MIQQAFFTIKEPCQQGWENMSVSEKGRFCSSCNKQVHDFSNSSIDDIKKAYSESRDGLCGHVPVKVLQEQYVENFIQTEHFSYLKRFWIAAVFCFGASLFTVDDVKASSFYKIKTALFKNSSEINDTISVKGVVKDNISQARIPYVAVAAICNNIVVAKAQANINGEYEIRIPKTYNVVDFKAIYLGYNTRLIKNISVTKSKNIVVDIDMQMKEELMLEGEIESHNIVPK